LGIEVLGIEVLGIEVISLRVEPENIRIQSENGLFSGKNRPSLDREP
jgi:hypothetical protein